MTLHECIAGLMVRCGMVGKRPNGFTIYLSKTTYLLEINAHRPTPARLRASDCLAEAWTIVQAPLEAQEPIGLAE
jgi:hypothetical protein